MRFTFRSFSALSSTNDKARNASFGSVIIAKTQSAARGRFKRTWSSGKGGAWFSLVLPLAKNPAELTFIASLSVHDVLTGLGVDVSIKWPNDIVTGNLKVCGILTENLYGKKPEKSILGIGLNANNILPSPLKKNATSLKSMLGKEVNVQSIIRDIVRTFKELYLLYRKKGFSIVLRRWKKSCSTLGKKVEVRSLHGKFSGKAVGIDKNCRLLVRAASGKIRTVTEGDVFIFG